MPLLLPPSARGCCSKSLNNDDGRIVRIFVNSLLPLSYLFLLHGETGQPLAREYTPTPHLSPPLPSPPTDVALSRLNARRGCLFVCSQTSHPLVQPAVQPAWKTGLGTPRAMMSRYKTRVCAHTGGGPAAKAVESPLLRPSQEYPLHSRGSSPLLRFALRVSCFAPVNHLSKTEIAISLVLPAACPYTSFTE